MIASIVLKKVSREKIGIIRMRITQTNVKCAEYLRMLNKERPETRVIIVAIHFASHIFETTRVKVYRKLVFFAVIFLRVLSSTFATLFMAALH